MLRSRLYWRVLANFGLLLLILTAMTVLTLNLLMQIEKNFTVASSDVRALGTIERIRTTLNDLPTAAYNYALSGNKEGREDYFSGLSDLRSEFALIEGQSGDSLGRSDMRTVKDYFDQWKLDVGDKLIALGDERAVKGEIRDLENRLQDVIRLDAKVRNLSLARSALGDLYSARIPSQLRYLDVATGLSSKLSDFVIIVNVLLAIFSVALGFVLTRSITNPVRLLKGGTQNIMAGKYEPISLSRTDELGDLASDFNKMSAMLGNNYNRLNAYSELVTTLNSSASMEDVERKALEILCKHTRASIGALYLVVRGERALELVSGYALKASSTLRKRLAFGEGIPGQCAAEAKVLEVEGISVSSGFIVDTGLGEIVPSYVLAVPITFRDEVLGVLILGVTKPFGELEKEIVHNSVPQLGVALTNAMNYEATRSLSVEIAKRNDELSTKNKEIEKAYKVKSDFLSSMSHELRTPLNSIIGFSSVLLGPSGDPLTDDQRMALEKVLKNGRHLLQLINDILDISKLESGRMTLSVETEEIGTILSNCILLVEPLVQSKRLTLTQDIQPNLPALSTDIVKVRQIIVNLLSNASKFTEKGGISIKVAQGENGIISFAVKDSGIGIAQKDFERVFEEFQQVDTSSTRKYKGTGLGLPIARKLARMLGGDLTVDSVLGKGSTFMLTIPAKIPDKLLEAQTQPSPLKLPDPAPAKAAPAVSLPQPGIQGQQVQILSIDDDPDVIEILRKYLVPEGYSIAGALSGDEGMEMAAKMKPALITLDIMMPKKDGWQVLRELKQNPQTRDIPVIIHSIVDNKPLAMSLGAVDVMTKPTDPKRLLTLVKKYYQSGDQFILLVDDNLDFALACKDLLKQDGLSVKIATRGEEAIKVLEESIPSLILLDLVMPGMDGFGVVRELQRNEQWKKIPIIVLTGKLLTDEDHKQLDPHVVDYLMKESFTTEAISNAIKRILTVTPLSKS
jgi:signal transduction histidine kinase/DNA-binding response OmpR family regulator/HAMP domain-containing protein/CHASE3 domain sensor protein